MPVILRGRLAVPKRAFFRGHQWVTSKEYGRHRLPTFHGVITMAH